MENLYDRPGHLVQNNRDCREVSVAEEHDFISFGRINSWFVVYAELGKTSADDYTCMLI